MKTGCFSRYHISHFQPPDNSVLISIVDPETQHPWLAGVWDEVLRLKFWDYNNQDGPNNEDLTAIWDFIEKHRNKNIFAHCEAGISRSGAIREFLHRNGWELIAQQGQIFPNDRILRFLNFQERNRV